MTEQPQSPDPATEVRESTPPAASATTERQSATRPPEAPSWQPPPDSGPAAIIEEKPEIAVGAAFAGGFALAMILKRFAR